MNYKILIVLFSLSLLFSYCRDSDDTDLMPFEQRGMLVGIDAAECACCGGFIIQFDNSETNYRAYTEDFQNLDPNDFPLTIEFNWTLENDCAGIMIIEIEDYEIFD